MQHQNITTISEHDTQHKLPCVMLQVIYYTECHYAGCRVSLLLCLLANINTAAIYCSILTLEK
jgi:hypothetical protein